MDNDHQATLIRSFSVADYELVLPVEQVEVFDQYIPKFGIADAREISKQASNRPAELSRQTFVIRTNFITLEAQNALLKTIEEPMPDTGFVFVIPPDLVLIPTLFSRFGLTVDDTSKSQLKEKFNDFLSANYKERLALIESANKKKDHDWYLDIKKGLILFLMETSAMKSSKSIIDFEYVSRMLLTRGASNKMLLEHLALVLPLEAKSIR